MLWTAIAILQPSSWLFFLDGWAFFALGVALAEAKKAVTWQVLLLIAICLFDFWLNKRLVESIVATSTAACIAGSTRSWGGWLNREPVMHYVGTWSYSLYLTHVPIGCWLVLRGVDPHARSLSADYFGLHLLVDVSALTTSIVAAFVFWHWFERPSILTAQQIGTAAPDAPKSAHLGPN